jgi:hypothetical protein
MSFIPKKDEFITMAAQIIPKKARPFARLLISKDEIG